MPGLLLVFEKGIHKYSLYHIFTRKRFLFGESESNADWRLAMIPVMGQTPLI
jgi:hypothetical protein